MAEFAGESNYFVSYHLGIGPFPIPISEGAWLKGLKEMQYKQTWLGHSWGLLR